MKSYNVIVLTTLCLTGCMKDDAAQNIFFPSDWKVISLSTADGEYDDLDSLGMTVSFRDSENAVVTGLCNSGPALYKTGDKSYLEFQWISLTERACAQAGNIESRYIDALSAVDQYEINEDTLILRGLEQHEIKLLK